MLIRVRKSICMVAGAAVAGNHLSLLQRTTPANRPFQSCQDRPYQYRIFTFFIPGSIPRTDRQRVDKDTSKLTLVQPAFAVCRNPNLPTDMILLNHNRTGLLLFFSSCSDFATATHKPMCGQLSHSVGGTILASLEHRSFLHFR